MYSIIFWYYRCTSTVMRVYTFVSSRERDVKLGNKGVGCVEMKEFILLLLSHWASVLLLQVTVSPTNQQGYKFRLHIAQLTKTD